MSEELQRFKKDLVNADRVNGKVIRLCCGLYTMARNAGVDPELPVMKMAEEALKVHSFWDAEQWEEKDDATSD